MPRKVEIYHRPSVGRKISRGGDHPSLKYKKLYTSSKYRKARNAWLRAFPWCAQCAKVGRRTQATTLDHIKSHRGDEALFWNRKNWQSLCKTCHDRKTAKFDGGFGNKQRSKK